jgi:hypothetical protein
VWALFAGVLLEVRLSEWRSEAEMVELAAERSPDSYTLFRKGLSLQQQGDLKGSFDAFMASLREDPVFSGSCAPPILLLDHIGARSEALSLKQQLSPLCASRSDFAAALSAGTP